MDQTLYPVSLISAFADAEPALQEKIRSEILRVAGQRSQQSQNRHLSARVLSLYIRVPREMDAWSRLKVEPAASVQVPVSLTVGQRIACEQVKRYPGLSPSAFSVPDPDIKFLRLDHAQVVELALYSRTRAERFPDGLRVVDPPDGIRLGRGYVESKAIAPIRVRKWTFVVKKEEPYFIGDLPDDPEYEVAVGIGDLYVDGSLVLYLREAYGLPLSSRDRVQLQRSMGDPLPERVYGVDLLCRMSKEQYGPSIATGLKLPSAKDVMNAFRICDPKLFSKSERAAQAARLTRPGAERNQGLASGERREFTDEARSILDSEYALRAPFVSDALALIVHATKQWISWRPPQSPPDGEPMPKALFSILRRYGFKGIAEIDAIFAFITWNDGHYTHPPTT